MCVCVWVSSLTPSFGQPTKLPLAGISPAVFLSLLPLLEFVLGCSVPSLFGLRRKTKSAKALCRFDPQKKKNLCAKTHTYCIRPLDPVLNHHNRHLHVVTVTVDCAECAAKTKSLHFPQIYPRYLSFSKGGAAASTRKIPDEITTVDG